VLSADLSLDGFLGREGLAADWPREYDDEELARYRRRIILKAGVVVHQDSWTVDAIADLLQEGGDEEWAPVVAEGGPRFCQELARRRLVDEYRITIHPVVLGEGDRLFTVADRFYNLSVRMFTNSIAYVLVPVSKYRDRPPPYPWSAWSEGPGEDDDDAQAEDPAESPPPG
jgi:dihydrofolate reductase